MKVRFRMACNLGTTEYEDGAVHDLDEGMAQLAIKLLRAVPYVEPEPESAQPPPPPAV